MRGTRREGEGREDEIPWITWWCGLRGNEYLCEVGEFFIRDQFNLTGLDTQVPYYDAALDILLNADHTDQYSEETSETIQSLAETLYGLIHGRYILTGRGLAQMGEKCKRCEFGRCPRVTCSNQAVVPVGLSDRLGEHSVKLYCPACNDVYNPRSNRQGSLDGAFFGTTFPHLLLHVHPELLHQSQRVEYIPRIYGFKIHPSAWKRPMGAVQPPKPSINDDKMVKKKGLVKWVDDANYPGEDKDDHW